MTDPAIHLLQVLRAEDFVVTSGANLGDGLTEAAELMPDDVYGLRPGSRRRLLALAETGEERRFRIAAGGDIGTGGNAVWLDSALTFMCPDGTTTEGLVFVETDAEGLIRGCCLLPLGPVEPRRDYALVEVDRGNARARLAEIACAFFARGTRIALADGSQRPIEALAVGDLVLTRDNGPQAIRWIGTRTLRAAGAFAPIAIAPGALDNAGELMLSPNHRLLIWQERERGRKEVMVRARHLVNGSTVVQTAGGFVDYFQLLFDRHEIIYAEGIAAESQLVDTRVRPALPEGVPSHEPRDAADAAPRYATPGGGA